MVAIRITGGVDAQQRIARHVSRWFLSEHMPEVRDGIQVYIRFVDSTVGDHLGESDLASTVWNDRSSWNCRSYTIRIDKTIRNHELLVETVIHELIHVRQMATRTLRYTVRNDEYDVFWNGVSYAGIPYSAQPWERQAHALDQRLANAYIESGLLRQAVRRAA
jgi:hypothetical protein